MKKIFSKKTVLLSALLICFSLIAIIFTVGVTLRSQVFPISTSTPQLIGEYNPKSPTCSFTGISRPSIAWSGSNFAIVWADFDAGIFFTVLDSRSNILRDTNGNNIQNIKISQTTGYFMNPRVVWNGNEYGVIWLNDLNRDMDFEICFARLSPYGTIIGSTKRFSSKVSIFDANLEMVWNGSEYGVVWLDRSYSDYPELYFAKIVLDRDRVVFCNKICLSDSRGCSDCSIAYNRSKYAIAWKDLYTICYKIVDSANLRTTNSQYLMPHYYGHGDPPSLAWVNSMQHFKIVYTAGDDTQTKIFLASFDNNGNHSRDSRELIYSSMKPYDAKLIWNGSEGALAFKSPRDSDENEIYFQRLNQSGDKIGNKVRIVRNGQDFSLVWANNQYGIIWYEINDSLVEFYFETINCGIWYIS